MDEDIRGETMCIWDMSSPFIDHENSEPAVLEALRPEADPGESMDGDPTHTRATKRSFQGCSHLVLACY